MFSPVSLWFRKTSPGGRSGGQGVDERECGEEVRGDEEGGEGDEREECENAKTSARRVVLEI